MVVTNVTRMPQGAPLQHQLRSNGEEASSQGELDGLCGLYAGVNALRLLFAVERRLRHWEVKRLFSTGIAFLHERGELAGAATEGFRDDLWRSLLAVLVAEAEVITGRTIAMTQPLIATPRPSRAKTFAVIEAAIAADRPVLIELSGTYQHFTVIGGYSPSRLFVYDSGTLYWLTRKSCMVVKGKGEERHHINPRSLTILALGPTSST